MENKIEINAAKALQAHKVVFTEYLDLLERNSLKTLVSDKQNADELRGKIKFIWTLQGLLKAQLP
jgi:hypothetical protein